MADSTTLNEAGVWRGIARRLDAWNGEGVFPTDWLTLGVSPSLWVQMDRRLNVYIGPLDGMAYGPEDREAAILGVLWLALEAEGAGNNGGTNQ